MGFVGKDSQHDVDVDMGNGTSQGRSQAVSRKIHRWVGDSGVGGWIDIIMFPSRWDGRADNMQS